MRYKVAAHSTGFFIPLPKELASLFPSLLPHDDSPCHVTFAIAGDLPASQQKAFARGVSKVAENWQGPVTATLGELEYFVHPHKDRRVAYVSVYFDRFLAEWRSELLEYCRSWGMELKDFSPLVYRPHVTLAYLDGLDSEYEGPIPQGSWTFDSMEIWNLQQPYTFAFGRPNITGDMALDSMALRVAARYKKKVLTDDGNVRYEYGPIQVSRRHKDKAERLEKLRGQLSSLRSKIKRDIFSEDTRTKLLAIAVSLIDETYARVGNPQSAEKGRYGVTGWKVDHITFSSGNAEIKYVGKSGVSQKKTVESSTLVKVLKGLCEGKKKSEELLSCDEYSISAKDVNEYLKEFDVTAKDLRGFHANREMQKKLKEIRGKGEELPRPRKDRDKILKKEFKDALEEVASIVGHKPATLRSDYLVPGLEDHFMKDGTVMETYREKKGCSICGISLRPFRMASNIYPLTDPRFNFREIYKQICLLEDHLNNPQKHCPDCIIKHHLTIEAFAEEARSLDVNGDFLSAASSFIRLAIRSFNAWRTETFPPTFLAQMWRSARKSLIPLFSTLSLKEATKTRSEKEDENAQSLLKGLPKKKPPRNDLRNHRMKMEDDPDLDQGDKGDDPDLSLNYKRVAYFYLRNSSRNSGEVWKTDNGQWAGKNKDDVAYFDSKDKATSFAQGGNSGIKEEEESPSDPQKEEDKPTKEEQETPDASQKEVQQLKELMESANYTTELNDSINHVLERLGLERSEGFIKEFLGRNTSRAKRLFRQKNKNPKDLQPEELTQLLEQATEDTAQDMIDNPPEGLSVVEKEEPEIPREKYPESREDFRDRVLKGTLLQKTLENTSFSDEEIQSFSAMTDSFFAEPEEGFLEKMEQSGGGLSEIQEKAQRTFSRLREEASVLEQERSDLKSQESLTSSDQKRLEDIEEKLFEIQNEKKTQGMALRLQVMSESFAEKFQEIKETPPDPKKIHDLVEKGLPFTESPNPKALGAEMALHAYATKQIQNPLSMVSVGEGENRGEKSFDVYRHFSADQRRLAVTSLQDAIKKAPKNSEKMDDLKAQLEGLTIAAIVQGDDLDSLGLERTPSRKLQALTQALHRKGDAKVLFGAVLEMGTNESGQKIQEAIQTMSDDELVDFLGEDYNPFRDSLHNMENPDKDHYKHHVKNVDAVREYLRDVAYTHVSVLPLYIEDVVTHNYPDASPKEQAQIVQEQLDEIDKKRKEQFKKKVDQGIPILEQCIYGTQDYGDDDSLCMSFDPEIDVLSDFMKNKDLEVPITSTTVKIHDMRVDPQNASKVLRSPVDPPARKSSSLQSFVNTWLHIYEGDSSNFPSTESLSQIDDNIRRTNMSQKHITQKSAAEVTGTLDRVASLFEHEFTRLGVPKNVAVKFAYQCDLLSDHIQEFAAKKALTEYDPVQEDGFDPEEVGKETDGPLEGDADESSYMDGEFTQQENRELRQRQQGGDLGTSTIDNPRDPQPGKQADLEGAFQRLHKMAFADTISDLSTLLDEFEMADAQLQGQFPELHGKLKSSLSTHVSSFQKARKGLLKGESGEELSGDQLLAVNKMVDASREVLPILLDFMGQLGEGTGSDSPSEQLRMDELMETQAARLVKLFSLSANIVSKEAGSFTGAEKASSSAPGVKPSKKASSTQNAPSFSHGFNLDA